MKKSPNIIFQRLPRYKLKDLLQAITPKNVHKEIDTGFPVGREAL